MAFKYRVEKTNPNGTQEVSAEEFSAEIIHIGRGAAADIRFDSPLVSLVHMALRCVGTALYFEDLGSTSGVIHNGVLSRSGELHAGDLLKLGDIELTVFQDGSVWGLTRKLVISAPTDDEVDDDSNQLAALDITKRLPRLLYLSIIVALAVAVYYFAVPYFGTRQMSWSSGPLAMSHSMIETDCKACHATPFQPVQDRECLACHKMSDHSETLTELTKAHSHLNLRCAECHMDHNGTEGLIAEDSRLCINCHANIKQIAPESNHPNVPSFMNHPEFSVIVYQERDRQSPKRVLLSDPAAEDLTKIKLNHKVHLAEGLRGAHGPVNLQCRDCHAFSPDLKKIEPIKFDKHCRSCHTLEFDERLPGAQVPHGNTDEVVDTVFASYAQLLLDIEEKEPETGRLRPGKPSVTKEKVDFARAEVQKKVRETETLLFTKTACQLCHTFSEKSEVVEGKSRFDLIKPHIPERWFPASVFDHGAHQELSCNSCHKGVGSSEETTDILLPRISTCRECHVDGHKEGKVTSDCIQCHSYHDALEFENVKRRPIQEILPSW